jgi:myo-inositol 2-dehydrogenase / D-chiro-inositol 1-dehydrogenase
MNENNSVNPNPGDSRRSFLKKSSALAAASIAAPYIALAPNTFANSQTLKVGLVGCGGRGRGAAREALKADNNVVLTAVGDIFDTQIDNGLKEIEREMEKAGTAEKMKVEHRFSGLDAFQKVIDSGVDVVLLATPPGFRPQHLKAAVAAGKHVFCEKPVATDAPGVRTALEAVEEARKKNLGLLAGFCWRYSLPERALFERIHAGEIGDVRVFYGTYYTGPVKPMPPAETRPPGMGDLEWQVRNWYNFGWLSGDGLVEQAVHAVDWMCWAFKDVPPVKAVAVGGRQIPAHGGNIFDHFEINYEYPEGARGFLGCRQITGCMNDNTATIYGTKGTGRELGFNGANFIKGEKNWRYSGERPNMYQVEHNEFFASLRAGRPLNDGVRLCHSTMVAIMGRMAAYTGEEITWDAALNSEDNLVPEQLDWKMKLPVRPMAMPGQNRVA